MAHEPFVTELCALVAKHRHVFTEIRQVTIKNPTAIEVQLDTGFDGPEVLRAKHESLHIGAPYVTLKRYEE